MAEQAISRLLRHVEPILTFADTYIGEDGLIRPIGEVDQNYKTADKKSLKVPRNYEEWSAFKHEEDVEIFNPFVVRKHMVFLAELVRRKLNLIYSTINDEDEDDMFDDDAASDMDECVMLSESTDGENHTLTFEASLVRQGTEKRKRPIFDVIPVAEGTHENEDIALWLACVNAIVRHQRKVPEEFESTTKLIESMERILEKFQKERKEFIKEERQMDGLNSEDVDGFEDDYEPQNFPNEFFLFRSGNDFECDDEILPNGDRWIIPKYKNPLAAENVESASETLFGALVNSLSPEFEMLEDIDLSAD